MRVRQDWLLLVEQVKSGSPAGMEEAYVLLRPQIQRQIESQLGRVQSEDRVHDAFLVVLHGLKAAEFRDVDRLRGWVKTVIARKIAEFISGIILERRNLPVDESSLYVTANTPDPEQLAIRNERDVFVRDTLKALRPIEAEILTRFYMDEAPEKQIREEMDLTETQFRLLKSRSLNHFEKIGKRLMMYPNLTANTQN